MPFSLSDFFRLKKTKQRINTPTILQMEITECGAAALGIILAYYGRYESLENLRIQCGISRDGSRADNILKAARHYDMTAEGLRFEPDALSEIPLPFIAHWEMNHFVVIEGYDEHHVYINDPATGPRTISKEQFDQSFTGIALSMIPGPAFKGGGKPFSLLGALKTRLQGSMSVLGFIIITSLALIVPGILIPGFSKIFIDEILINHLNGWFIPLLLGLALTGVLRALFTWLQQNYLLRLRIKLMLTSSTQFLWHVLALPISFFQQRFAGDITERVSANDRLADLLSNDVSTSIVSIFTMVFYAAVMALLSWQLTVVGIAIAIINSSLLIYVSRNIENASRDFLQQRGRLMGIEMSGVRMIEMLKSSASEDSFFKRWAGIHAKTINSQQKIALYSQVLLITSQLLSGISTTVLLGFGSWQIIQGRLTIGSLIALQSLLASFNGPLSTLLGFGSELQKIRGDLSRLNDVSQHPIDKRLTQQEQGEAKKLLGKITVNNVTFGYSPLGKPLFEDLSLNVEAGSKIAIVGETGSGKTTLAKLIVGLYPPQLGQIFLDDKPLAEITQQTIAKSLALVDQDIFLFSGTIRENLTLWDKQVPDTVLENAMAHACITDVVNDRSGFDSEVLENGSNFSGGQRQRLEIARALVNDPTILILDEATANLDPIVEKQIFDNLKMRRCTSIIISHRLSTIRDCDMIYVLHLGQIVQQGSHDTLMQADGLYRQLIKLEL